MSNPPRPKIWITRTEPGASASMTAWKEAGFAPIVAPLLRVEPVEIEHPISVDAVPIFTSAQGVYHSGLRGPGRAYAVGDKTAEAAKRAGFDDIITGPGQVNGLAEVIEKEHSNLVYLRGERTAGDLAGQLRQRGHDVQSLCVYRTMTVEAVASDALACSFVALYSAFAAEVFEASVPSDWHGTVLTLSEAVAAPVKKTSIWIAEQPTQNALIQLAQLALASKATR